MKPIKNSDLQNEREQQLSKQQLTNNVDSLGYTLVTERLARVKAEKGLLAVGKQVVQMRLALLRLINGGN